MFDKQLTVEQRLTKAVVDIMGMPEYIAMQGVLMIGKKAISDKVPTACTNGRDELYGRAFVNALSDAEFRYLILHECYHKMYRHLITWRHLYKENARLANAACDYVINNKLNKDAARGVKIKMPKDGLADPQYDGMDSQQVYELLKKNSKNSKGGKGGKGGDGLPDGFDEHDWDSAEEMTEEEQHALEREIDLAIRQGVAVAGKIGSDGDRSLDELLQPKVDWREVLREFVSATCAGKDFSTWRRPNRRYVGAGYYMPSSISESVGELVLAIDTSGSIGGKELSQFLGEVKGICDMVKPERVRLLYWDTRVCGDETYEQVDLDKLVSSTKPKGGGGTTVTCVPEYMTAKRITPQAVVVLTDGYIYGGWGQWNCPVLWCIVNNRNASPTVGKAVHVEW